jgi:hypothetical protein
MAKRGADDLIAALGLKPLPREGGIAVKPTVRQM